MECIALSREIYLVIILVNIKLFNVEKKKNKGRLQEIR